MTTTSPADWPERFEAVLREHLPGLSPDAPLPGATTLADHGLSSLGTVNLLVALEDEFDVVVPDELLTATTFETADTIWAVLREVV